MFLGLDEHVLDDKGRLVLPRKHRAALAEGCILSRGHDGSVEVWPAHAFRAHLDRSSGLSDTRGRVRAYRRGQTSISEAQTPDRQGRIAVPDRLRRYAGLESRVVVTGNDDHLDLWTPERWAVIEADDDEIFRGMDEDLFEIGVSR